MVFVALGHFERKGLHLIFEAMGSLGDSRVKLWVVGGTRDLVRVWERKALGLGLADRVKFFGMQRDVRPFLWGADGFLLPTLYEVFPLVTLEAAASGLPLLVTHVYGVEEFVQDGSTGLVLERSPKGVTEAVSKFVGLPEDKRKEMGLRARQAVRAYSVDNFVEAWRKFFRGWFRE
jgi:glycosyltransferase involved in cell wall biosynthesis